VIGNASAINVGMHSYYLAISKTDH